MERENDSMVLIAIFVSRFEAIEIASMLRGYGLLVSLDGEAHAATEYISLALGGHRLRVANADYETASDILRQCGVEHSDRKEIRPTSALKWLVGVVASVYATLFGTAVIAGAAPLYTLVYIPFAVYSFPIDPKGRPDYFLSEREF